MNYKNLFQKPDLHSGYGIGERKVSWLELFFDLFIVVIMFEIVHTFSSNFSLDGLWQFIVSFAAAWWVWMGIVYYNERFETHGLENRLISFLVMIPTLGLAIFSEEVIMKNYIYFILSYLIARTFVMALFGFGTYYNREFWPTMHIFLISFIISVVILVFSLLTEGVTREIFFTVGVFLDIFLTFLTVKEQSKLPPFSNRLTERYGLFILIVLGECIRGVVQANKVIDDNGGLNIFILILGVLISLSLWWVYFDYTVEFKGHSNTFWSIIWGYLHLPLGICLALFGVTLFVTSELPDTDRFPVDVEATFLGSIGLYLFILSVLDTILIHKLPGKQIFSLNEIIHISSGLLLIVLSFIVFIFNIDLGIAESFSLVSFILALNIVFMMYYQVKTEKRIFRTQRRL